ncbi:MAG TPA: endonuclease III [Actinomycetota bacterium]|nr:endonuclease III [Actinomycetota bacterium]
MARFLPPTGYDPDDARRRVRAIVRALEKAHPDPRPALIYSDPFQLLISVILSAQTTDISVNAVTPELFRRYPTPHDLAAADPSEVEVIVRSTGFFRQKTKSIIGTSRVLVDRFGGEVPRTMDELLTVPGAARKSANVVLAHLWPRPESDHGIFVDTHVRRTSLRLALTDSEDPVKIERHLMDLLPQNRWARTPHQLIMLGRGPCNAKAPRHEECPLLKWCPTGLLATGAGPAGTGGAGAVRAKGKGSAAESRPRRRRPLP